MNKTLLEHWKEQISEAEQSNLLNRLSIEGFRSSAVDFEVAKSFSLDPSPSKSKKAVLLNSYESERFNYDLAKSLGVEDFFILGSNKITQASNIHLVDKNFNETIEENDYVDCHFLSFDDVASEIIKYDNQNVCINLSHPHNSGASIVQEFVYALNFLDKFIQSEIKIKKVLFILPIDSLLMANTAKVRSFKYLVSKMLEANKYEIEYETLGTCSLREQTLYDPYNNMLRNSTSVMGQIFGGTDYISSSTFDSAFSYLTQVQSSDNSVQNAINIMNVLIDESKLDFFNDISKGSFTIENLTASIIKEAWESFLNWNERDFFLEFDQFVQGVKAISNKRFENINHRKTIITGVTKFANKSDTIENLYKSKWVPVDLQIGKFPLRRNSYQFENLKITTQNLDLVLKCTIFYNEELKKVNARVAFVKDILELIDLEIELVKVSNFNELPNKDESDVIILCSTSNDYEVEDNSDYYYVGSNEVNENRIYAGMNVYKFLEMLTIKAGAKNEK